MGIEKGERKMNKDFLDNAIEEHDEYERENKKIESEKFFSNLKERKQKNTVHDLDKIYDNCLSMLNKYKITGQIESMKKIIFIIDCIEKEKRLVDLGFDCYIYRQDIDKYIDKIAQNDVSIIELERYERDIPNEIVNVIQQTKPIFDRFYILFTDYSQAHQRKIQKERINKDPILFGVFENDENINDRFYFLGDWIDEYCDLTLDKMVTQCKTKNVEILHKMYTPKTIEDLKAEIDNLRFVDGKYINDPIKKKNKTIMGKLKSFFK